MIPVLKTEVSEVSLGRFTPVKPTEQQALWATEMGWTFWIRKRSLIPVGIRTPSRPARTLPSTVVK